MLELKQIKKDYPAGDGIFEALKGISLQFRDSEFVSILGPSGCGKTTMLNIIGGLDQYTEGDLVINGRSTKDFKDRDWDTYRNHSIGFVFQSYNLIPHQTVLQNVELALTLSGVSKSERRKRAVQALEQVGLASQLSKRPGEMSGGQMQRVAIARAIVNNPDIILADEPTGALDTETSIQVMEILKKISADRLVIMVTHNPELAERYSTRIIRMLDGVITDDSAPLSAREIPAAKPDEKKSAKKPSMSFFTAFGLSLKNLFTKKGRTALTSFAGSIGIIGIALIFAVSHGMTGYIDTVQEDTLSSYPLTLEAKHMNVGELMSTFMGVSKSEIDHGKDAVYTNEVVYDMLNALNSMETEENDLRSFKAYLEEKRADTGEDNPLRDAVSGVQYTYDTELLIYTKSVDGSVIRSDTQKLMQDLMTEYFGMNMSSMQELGESYGLSSDSPMSMFSFGGSSAVLWQEMLAGDNGDPINPLLKKQYDVVYGTWPAAYNEIVLVLDENNELDDLTLYALGLKSKEEIDAIMEAAVNKTEVAPNTQTWSYEEICNMEFRTVLNSSCYVLDEKTGLYTDLSETEAGRKYLYDNGLKLKVTGIIRPNEEAVSAMLNGSIGYTNLLTKYVIEQSSDSPAVQAQRENPNLDIFTGLPFQESVGDMNTAQKAEEFRKYLSELDDRGRADTYIKIMSIPDEQEVSAAVSSMIGGMSRSDMEAVITEALSAEMNMSGEDIANYTAAMSDEDMRDMFTQLAAGQYRAQYAAGVQQQLSALSTAQLSAALEQAASGYTHEQCADYYDNVLTFSESDYDTNMSLLGCIDLDNPSTINLYAATFESKDVIEQAINDYNETVDVMSQITYTDYVKLMMSSVTTVINAITYVLIAFVAVSLVVSSIMIGVITLISVQERTKEIGILRAIGASKRNVSSMFNAETVIIGFTSGALGVLITYLLCIPINLILHKLTGIAALNAWLPIPVGIALVLISVLLTLISGIIPSRSAAKKDPVVALRTE